MSTVVLYGEPGWGSALAEAQLVWYGLDFEIRATGQLFNDPAVREALAQINPWLRCRRLSCPTAR